MIKKLFSQMAFTAYLSCHLNAQADLSQRANNFNLGFQLVNNQQYFGMGILAGG